ncbi:5852_t:CDS:2 [Rhizophagus irregularis]|nr:5852_t:CDS:2 [Rhizophagus irregularis]
MYIGDAEGKDGSDEVLNDSVVVKEPKADLILGCTFVDLQSLTNGNKVTVKALIDPKSQYNSISVMLARKLDLYITRVDGSAYPAVVDLGKGTTNADSYEHFLVKYDSVLGNVWLMRLVDRINGCNGTYWKLNEEKIRSYTRNSIDILSPLLY